MADKADEEIKRVAVESGVAELEQELETFILKTSNKHDVIRRRVSDVLNECSLFCRIEMDRLEAEIRSFDLDVVQLEADLADAKKAAEALKIERIKSVKTFEKKWNLRISRFERDLSRHSDRISDAIVDRMRNRGFVKTIADSTKLGSEVARRVDNEIASTVAELEEHLSSIVHELHQELDEQLEIYRKRCKLSNFPSSIAAASGGAFVVGAGLFGATNVAGAFTTATAAWAAVGTAGASVTSTTAQVGAVQATWAWFFGANTLSSTTAAGSATAAQVAATSAAIGASVTTIVTAGGAIAAVYIAKTLAHWGIAAIQENRVPAIVEAALAESARQVVSTLEKKQNLIVEDYSDVIDALIENQEERMQQIIECLKLNDPAQKEKRIERKEQLLQFLYGNNRLELKMQELPKLGMS